MIISTACNSQVDDKCQRWAYILHSAQRFRIIYLNQELRKLNGFGLQAKFFFTVRIVSRSTLSESVACIYSHDISIILTFILKEKSWCWKKKTIFLDWTRIRFFSFLKIRSVSGWNPLGYITMPRSILILYINYIDFYIERKFKK